MARVQRTCPLCLLGQAQHDTLWYSYQATRDYPAPTGRAQALGLDVTEALVKQHFQYHRIVQPPPKGYLKRERALARGQALPKRLQALVELVARVPGLSGTQLAETFYWYGHPSQLAAARNGCYRDLRRLLFDDFLYRYYPPTDGRAHLSGLRHDQLALFYLGREGVPLAEAHGLEIGRRDWINRREQFDDPFRVLLGHSATEIVGRIQRQLRQQQTLVGGWELQNMRFELSFQPSNWFGPQHLAQRFDDPLLGQQRIRPSGLAAIGLTTSDRQNSLLAPFFTEYDAGSISPARQAEMLLAYIGYMRSGALREHFPQLAVPGFAPPVLVVCRRVERVGQLQREALRLIARRNLARERLPVMVITDEATTETHALMGTSWLSLWGSGEERRHQLLEVLLRAARPLVGQLSAETVLRYHS
jgi:hypothetical protein